MVPWRLARGRDLVYTLLFIACSVHFAETHFSNFVFHQHNVRHLHFDHFVIVMYVHS